MANLWQKMASKPKNAPVLSPQTFDGGLILNSYRRKSLPNKKGLAVKAANPWYDWRARRDSNTRPTDS
jgi:hypothetical protein